MKNNLHINFFSLKAKSLAFGFWLLAFGLNAQVNCVINGGFDIVTNCTDPYPGYIIFAPPWDTLANGGGYGNVMNKCYPRATNSGIPFNLGGNAYQEPRTGNGYAYVAFFKLTSNPAVNWRWYIQQKIAYKLNPGKSYCVTYWASFINYCGYAVDELGAYFDDGSLQSIAPLKEAPANPQVKSPSGVFYADTLNWMKVQGTFTANGTEEYITLGNFRLNAAVSYTNLYGYTSGVGSYFIDDVSVIETDLPAFAGVDMYCIPGDSVFIGRASEIGLNDDCFWYKLPNTISSIDTVAGLWVKPIITTTYVVKQDICGMVKWDTVVVNQSAVGLKDLSFKSDDLRFYPNPASKELNIEFLKVIISNTNYKLSIINSLGQIIREEELVFKEKKATLNIKELKNGIYSFHLKNSKGQIIEKRFVVIN